jgi:hypothetical protein
VGPSVPKPKVPCANCGMMVPDDTHLPAASRTPCPRCRSTGRSQNVVMSGGVSVPLRSIPSATPPPGPGPGPPPGGVPVGLAVGPIVVTYADNLLATARRLFDNGDYSIAVVVAHMACEVAVERALAKAYTAKGVNYLEDAVGDLLPGYNLANDRVRKLYTALTGKDPTGQGYWPAFKASATRRNRAVHEGTFATQADAQDTLNVTSAIVSYLK